MQGLLTRLQRGERLVGDGAWGTQLMQRGLPEGQAPEWIALERPKVIAEIAGLYVDAGADLVTTDTFGGTSFRLALHDLTGEKERINRQAVEAVRRAVAGRAFVSASVGPTGRLLEPYGDTSVAAVRGAFVEQIGVLVDAGADLICVETMSDLTEATQAIQAAKEKAPDLPVMATMTFEPNPRGYYTVMGVSAEQAAAGLVEAGADIIGSNCGIGMKHMVAIARELTRVAKVPVAVQPNAGLPEMQGGTVVYKETPDAMAARVPELLDLGVALIGGCCGTTPEHVRALRQAVDAWSAEA